MQYRRYRYSSQFKGDGDETIAYGRDVPFGYALEVTHFSAGFITEDIERWQLGYVDQAGNQFPLTMVKHGQLQETHVHGKIWLEAGEKPYAKCLSMATAQTGFISVHGRLWPTKEKMVKDAEVQREPDVSDDSKPQ